MVQEYVLDAHALVWFLEGNPRLGANARAAMQDPASILHLPIIALADGNRITVLVNNQKVIEYTDPHNYLTTGQIALHHFASSVLRIRRVEVQELPPSKPAGKKPPE